jgi:peptidoglycan lytic transglycosylase
MPIRRRPPGLVLLALLLASCARATLPSAPPSPPPAPSGQTETGLASWYGAPHHGRRTASGEVYDMNDLSAAHRTLPLGTRVLVTNLDTGQAVEVRVNDRGPFVDGRILDVSYAAARLLGAVGPGVIRVRLRVVSVPGRAAVAGSLRYAVQLGAFTTRERAEAVRQAAARHGSDAVVTEASVGGEAYYRVQVGSYTDRAAAQAAARALADRGYQTLVVER